jgi:hypothetical protein
VFNDDMMTMMMGKAMPPFSCPFMPLLLLLLLMNDDHLNYDGGGNLLLMLLVVLLLHLDVCHLLTLNLKRKIEGERKKGKGKRIGGYVIKTTSYLLWFVSFFFTLSLNIPMLRPF